MNIPYIIIAMGAYTLVIGSEFNGMPLPRLKYVLDENHRWILPAISGDRAIDWKLGRFRRSPTRSCSSACGSSADLTTGSGSIQSHSFPNLRELEEALGGGTELEGSTSISVMATLGFAHLHEDLSDGYHQAKKNDFTNGPENLKRKSRSDSPIGFMNDTANALLQMAMEDSEEDFEMDFDTQDTVTKRKGTLIQEVDN